MIIDKWLLYFIAGYNPNIGGKCIICIISFIQQNILWALSVLFLLLGDGDAIVNKTKVLSYGACVLVMRWKPQMCQQIAMSDSD